MRIRLKTLKEILRKSLSEAPLADIVHTDNPKEVPGADPKDKRKVDRFFKSQKFHDDAVRLYRNVSVPIYVVPTFGKDWISPHSKASYDEDVRTKEIKADKRREILSSIGLSDGKVDELLRAVDSSAAVFITQADVLGSWYLPTPWMIVHAIYNQENNYEINFFKNEVDKKYFAITDKYREIRTASMEPTLEPHFLPGQPPNKTYKTADGKYYSEHDDIRKFLTMGSARKSQIWVNGDAPEEIICQAVLTTKGATFNPTGIDEIDVMFDDLAKFVNSKARTHFENFIRGKVIEIAVA